MLGSQYGTESCALRHDTSRRLRHPSSLATDRFTICNRSVALRPGGDAIANARDST